MIDKKTLFRKNGNIDGRVTVVAEVKTESPFGFKSHLSRSDQLRICMDIGDIISIHTNPLWGGSFEWLLEACALANGHRVLAKGFHDTIADVRRAFDCGATYVLTVGWWPDDPRCWHECETSDELKNTDAPAAVWNYRNPRTGKTSRFGFGSPSSYANGAREFRPRHWLCQASGIKTNDDVGDVEAILVGESLYK